LVGVGRDPEKLHNNNNNNYIVTLVDPETTLADPETTHQT